MKTIYLLAGCDGAGKTTATFTLLTGLLNCREFVAHHTLQVLLFFAMKTITLNLPDTLDLDATEVTMLLATRLYEQGKLSLGQAVELAGLSKPTFAELLGRYGVPLLNYPASDLARDVANA